MPNQHGQPSGTPSSSSSPPATTTTTTASAAAAVFSNRSFIDDDSNPPSYHSIYPTAINPNGSKDDTSKENKPSSSSSSSLTAGSPPAATSSLVANLFQNTSHGSQQEPISYDQLYSAAAASHYLDILGGDEIDDGVRHTYTNPHHHHHHHISCLPLPNGSVVVQHRPATQRHHHNNHHLNPNNSLNNRVRKQFHQIFTKGYLLKHFIFISASSMMIILFQIILINNQSILSHLAAGLWCGLANLFTLLITIITCMFLFFFNLFSSKIFAIFVQTKIFVFKYIFF